MRPASSTDIVRHSAFMRAVLHKNAIDLPSRGVFVPHMGLYVNSYGIERHDTRRSRSGRAAPPPTIGATEGGLAVIVGEQFRASAHLIFMVRGLSLKNVVERYRRSRILYPGMG